jgi:hypothetical protein
MLANHKAVHLGSDPTFLILGAITLRDNGSLYGDGSIFFDVNVTMTLHAPIVGREVQICTGLAGGNVVPDYQPLDRPGRSDPRTRMQ